MNNRLRIGLIVCFICMSFPVVQGQSKWFNPLEHSEPVIAGTHWHGEKESEFHRFPSRAKDMVRTPLWNLSKESAGLYISFYSNSSSIQIKYTVTSGHSMYHMPSTGVSGVDLFTYNSDGQEQRCTATMNFGDTISYNFNGLTYSNNHALGNEFRLFLPLYNSVSSLQIGVDENAEFEFIPLSNQKPIVAYGTSITQGACASRPGMAWTNILQRRLDAPVVNIGFSGNGQLEAEVFELLSEIDSELYIIDCLPNMTNDRADLIIDRVVEGYKILRKKSDAPILFVEHCGYLNGLTSKSFQTSYEETNEKLKIAYKQIRKEFSDSNIHYLSFEEIGFSIESQVDYIHPNDYGMIQYADAYEKKCREILHGNPEEGLFLAVKQRREPDNYEWKERHEAILELNKEVKPEVLMIGNSIVHFWAGKPDMHRKSGEKAWNSLFKNKSVTNLGFGWDRIENVKWRMNHGELSGFDADKVFLMIGTNNLVTNSNEEIVQGIIELTKSIKHYQPKAHLYVVKLLPRRAQEGRINELNALLEESIELNENLSLIDISKDLYLNEKVNESLFSDGLHPNEKGYMKMAKQLKPFVNQKR